MKHLLRWMIPLWTSIAVSQFWHAELEFLAILSGILGFMLSLKYSKELYLAAALLVGAVFVIPIDVARLLWKSFKALTLTLIHILS